MADIIKFRDYAPKYHRCTAYPVMQPATVVFLPMVMIEHGDGTRSPWREEKPLPKSLARRMRKLRDLTEKR